VVTQQYDVPPSDPPQTEQQADSASVANAATADKQSVSSDSDDGALLGIAHVVPTRETGSQSRLNNADNRPEKIITTASKLSTETEQSEGKGDEDEDDEWETVEVKPRGSRKRSTSTTHSHKDQFGSGNEIRKTKGARTPASRKKVANRKVVKEILGLVLDKVDDEVKKRRPSVKKPTSNPWKTNVSPAQVPAGKTESVWSTRGVVAGRNADIHSATTPVATAGRKVYTTETKRKTVTPGADQSTAPTYQETVSAVSTPSEPTREPVRQVSKVAPTRNVALQPSQKPAPEPRGKVAAVSKFRDAVSPPLPTLLNPESTNSAGSSVASSLEVPNVYHHRHVSTTPDENDVGYHLRAVCDRLSCDMSVFMSRRAHALSSRRRERGAILASLQDTISSLWPGSCHVELYGSCAVQLDLPSSDIDVVVAGLDNQLPSSVQTKSHQRRTRSRSPSRSGEAALDEAVTSPPQFPRHASVNSYMQQIPVSNGERVKLLAKELDKQAWAVRVNAIPTAAVPVVKVLCDPSRLAGASDSGSWMTQHKRIAADAAAASGQANMGMRNGETLNPSPQNVLQPWRGSDVMNGLLSLDITFEGPEHGGIGSTKYSAAVVNEMCRKTGQHQDATPFVQVLMVLKELLAQKKLNEPYSGGLSSYALLLLLVALVHERRLIRDEIDRAEQQRRAMTAIDTRANGSKSRNKKQASRNGRAQNTARPSTQVANSWASVAKNQATPVSFPEEAEKSKPSFADAVGKPASKSPNATGEQSVAAAPKPTPSSSPGASNSVATSGVDPMAQPFDPSMFVQSYNDIVEVLCSGETTSGKLLLHFLLHYGELFDAQATAIDISGKHERPYSSHYHPYAHMSPYMQRLQQGRIDPVTGVFSIDPIVIYDPLEGSENNNVSRRCFEWRRVRWAFAQSYSTLASAVEKSVPMSQPSTVKTQHRHQKNDIKPGSALRDQELTRDPVSPLLLSLISF